MVKIVRSLIKKTGRNNSKQFQIHNKILLKKQLIDLFLLRISYKTTSCFIKITECKPYRKDKRKQSFFKTFEKN